MTVEVGALVESLITQYLSPEQISGYLKEHHNLSLSHETIYRFTYEDKHRHEDLKPLSDQVETSTYQNNRNLKCEVIACLARVTAV